MLGIVSTVIALHLALLSFMFGPRRIEYALVAYFSAVFVWGMAFLLGGRRRAAIGIAGAAVAIMIQQAAYRTMAGEDFGFWWPLTQFVALHFLFVMAARAILDSAGRFVSGCLGPNQSS